MNGDSSFLREDHIYFCHRLSAGVYIHLGEAFSLERESALFSL